MSWHAMKEETPSAGVFKFAYVQKSKDQSATFKELVDKDILTGHITVGRYTLGVL